MVLGKRPTFGRASSWQPEKVCLRFPALPISLKTLSFYSSSQKRLDPRRVVSQCAREGLPCFPSGPKGKRTLQQKLRELIRDLQDHV